MATRRKKLVKKNDRFMNKVLIVLAVFLFAFIDVMIYLHISTGSTPDVLITCVFAACVGECSVMGWIKTTKEKAKDLLDKKGDDENDI